VPSHSPFVFQAVVPLLLFPEKLLKLSSSTALDRSISIFEYLAKDGSIIIM